MKRLLMLIPLVFLCCFGCQQGERVLVEPKADAEVDIQAIRNIIKDYETAVNASDIDRVMSFYADDAIVMRPNEPAAVGKKAVRSRHQKMYDEYIIQEKDVIETIEVSCDLAVAHILWSAIVTPKGTQETSNAKGNWIIVYKRQHNNEWKCIYEIWSDENLVFPE